MSWPAHSVRIVRGHRVASGLNGDPRFPGGTLAMQAPHFAKLGLDLSRYHPSTLNVSIAPRQYRVLRPWRTFERLQWHPVEPAETFSFFEARLRHGGRSHEALIYLPHPETKPEHFQSADVLEVLAPWIDDLGYGVTVELEIDPAQMVLE
ncbi:MAG: hypothetical protein JNN17_26845 [Verrucomicrobiaceae bacterium]|nr:hypothetical protein [Verrucomicrobiaceae bacterium]